MLGHTTTQWREGKRAHHHPGGGREGKKQHHAKREREGKHRQPEEGEVKTPPHKRRERESNTNPKVAPSPFGLGLFFLPCGGGAALSPPPFGWWCFSLLYRLGGGAFVPLSFWVVARCSPPSFVWRCVPSFDVAVCVAQLGLKLGLKSLTWTPVCKSLNQVSFCRARSTTSPKVEGRKTACIELNHWGNLRTFPFGGWKTPPRKKKRRGASSLSSWPPFEPSTTHRLPASSQPHRTTPRHATPRKNKVQW